jgi:hypothetical protein
MSWHYSQALVAAFSADTCSDGGPSAPSSATPTPQAYCSPDRMTAVSRLSRFGMTFAPLTADRGEALLMWYLAGFPARTLALPDGAQELTEPGRAYGLKWHESLARFDHDACEWKTVQHSLFGDSGASLVTWPRSGMTVGGACLARPMLARRTSANASGLLPTLTARDFKSDSCTPEFRAKRDAMTMGKTLPWTLGGLLNPTWCEWFMGFPLGWTEFAPLAMPKFHEWQQQHSMNYLSEAA